VEKEKEKEKKKKKKHFVIKNSFFREIWQKGKEREQEGNKRSL